MNRRLNINFLLNAVYHPEACLRLTINTALANSYLTLAGRNLAMARISQNRSGLIEDALVVAAGAATVAQADRPKH